MLRHVAVAIAVVAAGAASLPAQATGCEDAAARVGASALPRVGTPGWTDWMTLTGCGARGATVIAGALQSDAVRRETELTRLDHLAGLLDGWFQPSLINAYEDLLRSPDASFGVKLRAMWLLAGLYVPDVDVAGPLQGFTSARCEAYERTTTLRDAPATFPAPAYDRASEAVSHVADDPYVPEYVRSTAACWESVIRDGLAQGTREVRAEPQVPVVGAPLPPPVIVGAPVRVVYDCGSRFVFYNDAGYDLAVRYDGYGTGVLRVAHGGPFVWAAGGFGPVRFWLGERAIVYAAPVYRACANRVVVAPAIDPWYGWRSGLGVYVGARVVAPRVVVVPRAVAPRMGRPIVVVRPTRTDRYRDDGWNGPRGPERAAPPARPRAPIPAGPAAPRQPIPPRPAVPRQPMAAPSGPRSSQPEPPAPRGDRPRIAVPKGGGPPG
ncbi:MAG: hypothetical protein IT356_00775 [Gemmatimonadaceae bacterium]|nr:hypothetical protein [Gemmatimonadaceae bacterium]